MAMGMTLKEWPEIRESSPRSIGASTVDAALPADSIICALSCAITSSTISGLSFSNSLLRSNTGLSVARESVTLPKTRNRPSRILSWSSMEKAAVSQIVIAVTRLCPEPIRPKNSRVVSLSKIGSNCLSCRFRQADVALDVLGHFGQLPCPTLEVFPVDAV